MLPKYLMLKGFRSYINTNIDFTSFGDICCLIGENGNGKSSIIEGITTCLFWRNTCTDNKGAGMDAVINSDCDEMELEFAFEMNGVNYIINTTKKKGESRTLDFYIDGVNQGEKVTETQQKINDVLKMNYDTFLDTVCIGQGQASRFMNKKPNERKETLAQILDIKKYEEYEKYAKEQKKEYKKQIDILNGKIELLMDNDFSVEEALEEIKNLKKSLKAQQMVENDISEELEKVLQEKSQYEFLKAHVQNVLELQHKATLSIKKIQLQIQEEQDFIDSHPIDNVNYEDEIETCSNQINIYNDKMDTLRNDIDDIKNQIMDIKEKISNVKADVSVVDSKQAIVQNKYDKLFKYNKGECELCGQAITAETKQTHLDEWQQQIDKYDEEKSVLSSKISKLQKQGKSLSENGKSLSEQGKEYKIKIKDLEETKETLIKKSYRANQLISKIENCNNNIKTYQENLKDKQEELDKLTETELPEVEDKEFNDIEIKQQLKIVKSDIEKINSRITILKHSIEESNEREDEISKLKKELSGIKETYSDYTSVVSAFGKNGITAQIIEHDVPELEYEVNQILSLLSNNSLTVNFITSKASNKKAMDTFDIIVNDITGSRAYETYSGGEKFRVDFACHIGLSKFLTKRSGASIDFLMIDEGLGSQDDTAKQRFIENINALKGVFKQIIVITHIQDLQNAFPHKVFVQKDQLKGSYVEVA